MQESLNINAGLSESLLFGIMSISHGDPHHAVKHVFTQSARLLTFSMLRKN